MSPGRERREGDTPGGARPRRGVWLAVALGGALLVAVAVQRLGATPAPVPSTAPSASASGIPDNVYAARYRKDAFDACAASRWLECRDKLDDARSLDPGGERDPHVVEARAAAEKGLAPAPRAPNAP